jgi:hypothetical protein
VRHRNPSFLQHDCWPIAATASSTSLATSSAEAVHHNKGVSAALERRWITWRSTLHRLRLSSGNGSYISDDLEWLAAVTRGKIERWHKTLKAERRILLTTCRAIWKLNPGFCDYSHRLGSKLVRAVSQKSSLPDRPIHLMSTDEPGRGPRAGYLAVTTQRHPDNISGSPPGTLVVVLVYGRRSRFPPLRAAVRHTSRHDAALDR